MLWAVQTRAAPGAALKSRGCRAGRWLSLSTLCMREVLGSAPAPPRNSCRETLPWPHQAHSDITAESKNAGGIMPMLCVSGPSGLLTPGVTPIRKKEETLFDDEDDIMATLGFGDSPTSERRQTGDQ